MLRDKLSKSIESDEKTGLAGTQQLNGEKEQPTMLISVESVRVLFVREVAAAASSRILRHTNSKRSSSSSPNDYGDSAATGSLVKEHHRHQQQQQQQQINGKYLNSNENGGSSGLEDSSGASELSGAAGATLFSSSASSSSSSSSLSSPLSHNSPQTLTLTADKNKTKLLKCHCDICKDQNYVCETDGLCFTSLSLEHGVYKYSYSCQPKKYELADRLPLSCLTSKEKRNSFTIECCSTDFCNHNKLLQLPKPGTEINPKFV
ncbi:hypothetical protein RP20_CCG017773 [Aedes albopictus]|nr:hypothetical protein RP20_CCG017773 [Aedes albopictus]